MLINYSSQVINITQVFKKAASQVCKVSLLMQLPYTQQYFVGSAGHSNVI